MRRLLRRFSQRLPLDFRVLFRQFLLRVVDLEALSIEADLSRLVGQFAGLLIVISSVQTVGFLDSLGWPGMSRLELLGLAMRNEQSLLSATMLVAGLIAVVTWDNIFPDRRDVMVLGPLPIRPSTILAAKVAAAGCLLAIGVLALNFGMSVALPLVTGSVWQFPRVFAAYWFTNVSAGVFVYGSVLTLQGLTAALLPQRWFLRLSAIFQLAAFALFLSVWFFQPSFASPSALAWAQRQGILTRWPAFWFFALFGRISGVFPFSPAALAWRACAGLAAVIAGAAASLLLCYKRTMRKTAEEPDLIPGRSGRRWLLPFGDRLHTAVVQFSIRSLVRSRQHRVVYAFFLAIAFAIAVSTLKRVITTQHGQPLTAGFLMSTLMMLCLAVVGLRSILSLPVSLKANWVLQVTQLRAPERYIAATRRAMLAMATVPVWLTAAGLVLCHRPWRADAEHLLVLALVGSIVTDMSLIGVSKIPFACSYLPGKSNVQFVFWLYALVLTPLVMVFSRYELQILNQPLAYAVLVAVLAVIAWDLLLFNRHRAKSAVLYYEELEPVVITTLGIGSWQPTKSKTRTDSEVDSEADAEVQSHMEMRIEGSMAARFPPEHARRETRLRVGNSATVKERTPGANPALKLESLWRDVKFALRQMKKSPGFAVTAVLTLALGIGANALVFSVMDALLRPLNLPGGQSLYAIQHVVAGHGSPSNSWPDYEDMVARNSTFSGIAAYDLRSAGLDAGGGAASIWLEMASDNYFDVLQVKPYLGRFFDKGDDHGDDSAPDVVLSYAYWHAQFNADPGVVGRTVQLDKHPFTVLGVAPPDFRGTELFFAPALWIPIVEQPLLYGDSLDKRDGRGDWLIGRLKPNVTPAQAGTDLKRIAAELAKEYPKDDGGGSFSLAKPGLVGDLLGRPARAFMAGMMMLAGLILLAACANLGSLFAARAADRSQEIAVRIALGSGRALVLRQLLIEAVMVSLIGGAIGVACGTVILRWLSMWRPVPDIPIRVPVNPHLATYVISLLLTVGSGLLFGIVPVRQVLRADPCRIIHSGGAGEGLRRFSLRDLLLAAQIAICAVLLTASLVALRGLERSLHSGFGFRPQNAMIVSTRLWMAGYTDQSAPVMQKRMLDAVTAIPGVRAVGFADRLPLGLGWDGTAVYRDATTDYQPSNIAAEAVAFYVSPGYFRAAGTALLTGRTIEWSDTKGTPFVAVINQEFARRIFGSVQHAMGSYYKMWQGTRVRVVGVVQDGKYKTLTESPQPAMFLSILQQPEMQTTIVVRSDRDPASLAAALQETLSELDPGLPITIKTWTDELVLALFPARAATVALGVLGLLGAMLVVTGIFGLASYGVSQRLRELGIRMALGARRTQILRAALSRAFRLLVIGSVAGMVLGVLATRVLAAIVYQASPSDPIVLGGVVATMILLGLVATWIPAQRALAVDPMMLLRDE